MTLLKADAKLGQAKHWYVDAKLMSYLTLYGGGIFQSKQMNHFAFRLG